MKTLFVTKTLGALAILATAFSCVKEQTGFRSGEIHFSARSEISQITKTTYSGAVNTSNMERINWENTDLIRIFSEQVSEPSEHFSDYSITLDNNQDKYSYAKVNPVEEHGLQWGEGQHTFFSLYPSPSTSGVQSGLSIGSGEGGKANIIATLPADQSYATARTTEASQDYYGDMRLAYMAAVTSLQEEGNDVHLSFTPIVTTFYVTISNTTGNPMTLQEVRLTSNTVAMTGTFKATITSEDVRSYSYLQGGIYVGALTRTPENSYVKASFSGGRTLAVNENITVALFALPQNIYNLTLSVTSDETGTISLPVTDADNNPIPFTACWKHNLNNIGVPPVSYVLTRDKPTLEYDYTGVATTDQLFTVTSTKTIGSSTKPASWKTQIKNSSDEWVDLDGNCPDWLANFPLNSTGITTTSKEFQKDVTQQPVVSHVNRLKSNKVYDRDGNVYDNSTKANAIDLSEYNFINRRQEDYRTTANTYIIASPGWYRIPMVYGNLYEEGNLVAEACKGTTWALGHLDYFKKSTDANIWLGINYPWFQSSFLHHAGIVWEKYTVWNGTSASTTANRGSSAGTPVSSSLGVITNLQLDADEHMYFYVEPDGIRPGNVLLATYDDNSTCCWSWQIWITDQRMDLITVGDNRVLPVNIGWIDDTEGQYYPERSAVLKFVSTEVDNLETGEMTVTQPEFERVSTSGWQTYYQWGRKDPMAENVIFTYDDDGAMNRSIKYPNDIMYDASTKGVEDDGTNKYYDWTSANYNNLWDSQNNSWSSPTNSLPNHKTVYDPSPRGFSVPPDRAWDGLVTNGYTSYDNGIFFRTTSGGSETIFFPASGYLQYDTGNLTNASTGGYYWSIHPGDNTQRRASYALRFYKPDGGSLSIVPKEWNASSPFATAAYRAYAYSVRPVLYNVSASGSETIPNTKDQTVTFANVFSGSDSNLDGDSLTVGDVTVTFSRSGGTSGHKPSYENGIVYLHNSHISDGTKTRMTVSIPSGHHLIAVELIFDESDAAQVEITAASSPNDGGGYSDGKGKEDRHGRWTISQYSGGDFTPDANSITFTVGYTVLDYTRKLTGIYVVYQ